MYCYLLLSSSIHRSDQQGQLLRAGDEAISTRLGNPERSPGHIPEDKEAEDYVRKVLDELQTPSSLVDDDAVKNPQKGASSSPSHEQDDERNLEDSLKLPSVPTSVPQTSPSSSTRQKNIFTNPEDSDPSWCCICSDDANLKCLDCDNTPLFCNRCWKEMHFIEGSEEERKHRAIEFRRTMALSS